MPNNMSIPVRYDWNFITLKNVSSTKRISIPVRYDWNFTEIVYPTLFEKFQFQLGTIGTLAKHISENFRFISIPVRYDWNVIIRHACMVIMIFQFQLGTIGTWT